MPHTAYELHGSDGLPLFAQSWQAPGGAPRGAIALVHGMGEHSGRYAKLAEYLGQHGFATYAYDLRGHGRSGGPRVYVDKFDEYLSDTDVFLTDLRRRCGPTPVFLVGHSMGGTIAALYAITRQPAVRGLVLSSPAIQLGADIPKALIVVGRWLARALPRLPVRKIDTRLISRDLAVIAQAASDPLNCYGGTPARTGAELLNAMSRVLAACGTLRMPLYIFHGTEDRLTSPSGSQALYAGSASLDKTLRLYPGSYHETMNDLDREQVLQELAGWLLAHSQSAASAA